MVDDVAELEENLQITKEMITAAKNKVVCGACKAENEKDAVYCSKCGKKLTEVRRCIPEVLQNRCLITHLHPQVLSQIS